MRDRERERELENVRDIMRDNAIRLKIPRKKKNIPNFQNISRIN